MEDLIDLPPNPNEIAMYKKLRAIEIKLDNIECTGGGGGGDPDDTNYEFIVDEEYNSTGDGEDPENSFIEAINEEYES